MSEVSYNNQNENRTGDLAEQKKNVTVSKHYDTRIITRIYDLTMFNFDRIP